MKILKITAVLGLMLLFFSHCEKEELLQNTPIGQAKSLNTDDLDKEEKMIQLIRKLENPYTVEAMNRAQDTLVEVGIIKNPIEITTTHYYVRFLPSTWEELDNLEVKFEEEQNELFDFPLDYELSEDGTYYQDPSLPDTVPTWQYTVVPINYNFPNVQYEKLANLFLHDETKENTEIEEFIEDVSLLMTGNWDKEDEMPTFQKSIKASKWRPSGTIRAQDHQLGQLVPVEGTKVTMRRWFKWAVDYTDHNGYYESPKKFKKKVKYKIKWVTPKYRIRSGWYGVAWTVGPKQKGAWNVNLTQNLRHFYAIIHIAAHDFFYRDPFGLKKPNPIPKLKIAALDKCGTGVNHHFASIVGGPDIRIYRRNPQNSGCNVQNSLRIYGTTIHELGHSNQRSHGVGSFAFCSNLVRESWADCVEWSFSIWKYKTHNWNVSLTNTTHPFLTNTTTTNIPNNPIEYPFASIRDAERGDPYSPMFIDLIDCSNVNSQYLERNSQGIVTFQQTIDENVCGYTLWQIEQAIANKGWSADANTNMTHVRDYLINNFSNSTENSIERYFGGYYRSHF